MTHTEAEAIKELLQQQMGDIKIDLDEIKEQTTLTNGRVKELELRQERQKGWLQAMALGVPVLTSVFVYVLIERVLN
jgi:hypothetical protein